MQHKPPLIPYESFAFVAEPPELPTRTGRCESW